MKMEQKSWKGDQTGNSNPRDPRPRLWLCVFGVLSEKASPVTLQRCRLRVKNRLTLVLFFWGHQWPRLCMNYGTLFKGLRKVHQTLKQWTSFVIILGG